MTKKLHDYQYLHRASVRCPWR